MSENAQFEGWAVVELFGHTKEIGHVTTQYFGGAAMFQVDIPELPEREVTIEIPGYVDGRWNPAGAVVKKAAIPARSRLIGPSAIFCLNPCTEEFARELIDRDCTTLAIISSPDRKQLNDPFDCEEDDDERNDEDLYAKD